MNAHISYKDYFLAAMPSLDDTDFAQSVILIQEHNDEGALGLIINKPQHRVGIIDVLEHLNIPVACEEFRDQSVFMGGPVSQEQGFVIHDCVAADSSNSLGFELSASKDMLESIAQGEGPDNFIVTLGYSGWETGQLEKEIIQNDWLVIPAKSHILFSTPVEKRWEESLKLLGINPSHLSNMTGHA